MVRELTFPAADEAVAYPAATTEEQYYYWRRSRPTSKRQTAA
jgi:hypothetical protein